MASCDFDPVFALGLMSGTSADGVDAALVKTDGELQFEFLHAITVPYSDSLRRQLLDAARADMPLSDVLQLERDLTDAHVHACDDVLSQVNTITRQDVGVIGFHGHTIRHDGTRGLTWQLGDASFLSAKTCCRVVCDFRRRDMAAGGQGAPLAPLFHKMLLAEKSAPTVVLNLGGVANVTWIGANGEILAGDTGPGCGLLDAWAKLHLGTAFDRDGGLARAGAPDLEVVNRAMRAPFFQASIPKSADRYDFDGLDLGRLSPSDGAATLCAITVAAVASTVRQLPDYPKSIWVAGGGSKHPVLMEMLRKELGPVQSIDAAGCRADSLEAECFAWLAVRRLRNLATSVPETTGCSHPTCGGSVTA